jgi:hypothetical protein
VIYRFVVVPLFEQPHLVLSYGADEPHTFYRRRQAMYIQELVEDSSIETLFNGPDQAACLREVEEGSKVRKVVGDDG